MRPRLPESRFDRRAERRSFLHSKQVTYQTKSDPGRLHYRNFTDEPTHESEKEARMSQNHYVTKTKRRQKSGRRKDSTASTMAKLRELKAQHQALKSKSESP